MYSYLTTHPGHLQIWQSESERPERSYYIRDAEELALYEIKLKSWQSFCAKYDVAEGSKDKFLETGYQIIGRPTPEFRAALNSGILIPNEVVSLETGYEDGPVNIAHFVDQVAGETNDKRKMLIDFANHFKTVMCGGKSWSVESAVDSFLQNIQIR